MLLDTSGSIELQDLRRVQTLARNLLANLPAGCEVTIYKFDDDSHLLLEKTSQVRQVEQVIGALEREGRHTALYDALFDAGQYLEAQPTPRRAILIFTDGKNEGGETNLEEGLEISRRKRIPVFTVGVGEAINERVLRRIAEQTGGAYSGLSTTNGQVLANAIRRTFPASPGVSPGPADPRPTPASTPASGTEDRLPWLLLVILSAGALGGSILWQTFRRHGLAAAPESDFMSTTPPQRSEPLREARTVQEPMTPGDRTVRIQIKEGSLTVRQGQGAGLIFPVRPIQITLLGRSPAAQIPVHDPTVSYEHCRIVPAGGCYMLRDLGSTNGTLVNGTLVKEHVLRDGDLIQVGNTSFEFKLSPSGG